MKKLYIMLFLSILLLLSGCTKSTQQAPKPTQQASEVNYPKIDGLDQVHFEIEQGGTVPNWLEGITASEGSTDLTHDLTVNDQSVNFNLLGIYPVFYSVTDQNGNTTTQIVNATVKSTFENKVYTDDVMGHSVDFVKYQNGHQLDVKDNVSIFDENWFETVEFGQMNVNASEAMVDKTGDFSLITNYLQNSNDSFYKNVLSSFQNIPDITQYKYQQYQLSYVNQERYRLYIDNFFGQLPNMKSHLDQNFLINLDKLRIKSLSYEDFFQLYGTHIIIDGIFGGESQFICGVLTNDDSSSLTCDHFTNNLDSIKDHQTILLISYTYNGGTLDLLGKDENYTQNWMDSIENHESLFEINTTGAFPLWDLLPSNYSDVSHEMEISYQEYVNQYTQTSDEQM